MSEVLRFCHRWFGVELIGEDVSDKRDHFAEDSDYAASSSGENEASERGHSDPPVVSQTQVYPLVIPQPPRTNMTSNNGKPLIPRYKTG